MGEPKIGDKERALRALREKNFDQDHARSREKVVALREKVAAIPARKQPKQKKARR